MTGALGCECGGIARATTDWTGIVGVGGFVGVASRVDDVFFANAVDENVPTPLPPKLTLVEAGVLGAVVGAPNPMALVLADTVLMLELDADAPYPNPLLP